MSLKVPGGGFDEISGPNTVEKEMLARNRDIKQRLYEIKKTQYDSLKAEIDDKEANGRVRSVDENAKLMDLEEAMLKAESDLNDAELKMLA
jgi:hypothetical protein